MKHTMKSTELTGDALDYAVAICEGYTVDYDNWLLLDGVALFSPREFQPSTKWAQGGAIIECEGISLDYDGIGLWIATIITNGSVFTKVDKTPLIAAMRCYVASKMGDEVEVPNKLTQGE